MPPSFSSSSQLHIHVSAQDRPGILAETLAFIVQTGWNVVDIKQFVFNGLLNLSILLDGCDESRILSLREDCRLFLLAHLDSKYCVVFYTPFSFFSLFHQHWSR
ncbi:MAG TPA: hypothetical protein DHW17_03620 [Nitrospina sp.]|nr:hypothetical protein [Nitrospina sp.]